jgi:4-amino-4-deoxy-L-arabinose transferase-like glycosyltransferase
MLSGLVNLRKALRNPRFWLIVFIAGLLFACYTYDLSNNPPGFYRDESSIAYNAYTIARNGRDEHGVWMPLYFRAFGEYKNPTYIYLLAALFRLFGPSTVLARLLSVTVAFLAAVLLGVLAWRLSEESKRPMTGAIVALTAMWTPWLFETGRLVFEVALYPLALVLFLLAARRAHERLRWSWLDCSLLAATLALLTYTYSIGRLLAPLLAAGLVLFFTRERRAALVKTWLLYGLTLLPLLIFGVRHPGALGAQKCQAEEAITVRVPIILRPMCQPVES